MKTRTRIAHIDTAEYKYGFHVEKQPSILSSITRVINNMPFSTMQIYISNSRSKNPPKFDFDELEVTRKYILKNNVNCYIHGCLLYNLAGTVNGETDENYQTSLEATIRGLTAELDYAVAMGSLGVVFHPGSRVNSKGKDKDTKNGLRVIAETMVKCLTRVTPEIKKIAEKQQISLSKAMNSRTLIIENAAGEGTKLCSEFQEIRDVLDHISEVKHGNLRLKQVKVCIDTCHAFAAGIIDWGKDGEISKFYENFDKIIGIEYLELFHFNDAMSSEEKGKNSYFGSKKDRHQNLGLGNIFGDEIRFLQIGVFVEEARKRSISMIGEPPGPGLFDWAVVSEVTSQSKYPLVSFY